MPVNIPDLPEELTPADGDQVEIYDVSTSTNKRVTRTNFFGAPPLANNSVPAAALSTTAIRIGGTKATTGITVTTGETTLASVTVTVPAGGRSLAIIAQHAFHTGSGAGDDASWYRIKESTTVLNARRSRTPQTIDSVGITLMATITAPSAGSHTFTYVAQNDTRSSVVEAAATYPISIEVFLT